jgi:glucosamine-6-phosphate deaminase
MNTETKIGKLVTRIYPNRKEMGIAAAEEVSRNISELLSRQEEVNIIFAAAPSQNEFLESLCGYTNLDWNRVNAFHLDEYIGLQKNSPMKFGYFLKNKIFDRLPFRAIHYMDGHSTGIEKECTRYANLLLKNPADIICMGIGENNHIAFNDPHVADFEDRLLVKIVELDERSRLQQVRDGCFAKIQDVPSGAITLTIPALMKARFIYCVVPGKNKAIAVYNTLKKDIEERFPSTILRNHENAIMFLDRDSGTLL